VERINKILNTSSNFKNIKQSNQLLQAKKSILYYLIGLAPPQAYLIKNTSTAKENMINKVSLRVVLKCVMPSPIIT